MRAGLIIEHGKYGNGKCAVGYIVKATELAIAFWQEGAYL
jgi:hypothetical protein